MASPGIDEANILSGRRSKRPRTSDFPFISDEEMVRYRYGGVKRSRGKQTACRQACTKSPGVSTDANSNEKHQALQIGNIDVGLSQVLAPCNAIQKPSELDEDHGDGEKQEVCFLKVVPASRQSPLDDGDPHQQHTVQCYGKVARQADDAIYYK
ncbi:hypothetical protein AAVH_14491 [Aphelenchoides avenae]|nr:hypothetical protein AAVH_14491 [Aphelenchus avenae]